MTSLQNSVVLVTGANGGLGSHFVQQALDRGAAKVYASARNPQQWEDPRVVPLALDVTDRASIEAAAATADDVTVLINNAGISNDANVIGDEEKLRALFETNFFGPLAVANAFAPALRNHQGTLLDVHSVLSWIAIGSGYSASKAALWSATNTLRIQLAENGVHVVGLHLGYTDTPMTSTVDAPKNDPRDVVASAYDGIEANAFEVLADDLSRQVKRGLAEPIEAMYRQLAP